MSETKTPRTDAYYDEKTWQSGRLSPKEFTQQLEAELAAARADVKELVEAAKKACYARNRWCSTPRESDDEKSATEDIFQAIRCLQFLIAKHAAPHGTPGRDDQI